MSYDIVTVGEAMLRLWVPPGERLEDAPAYRVTVAGAEANVAIAAARMGARTAWLSALPNNPLGRRAAREVVSHGVDVSHVHWTDDARMGVYFVELSVPPRPISVLYDRAGSAAATMTADTIDWTAVEGAGIVHISGITPALSEASRDMAHDLVRRAHQSGSMVSLDVNYRRLLWEPEECATVIGGLAGFADVLISTSEDARDVFDISGPPAAVVQELQAATGVDRVILTAGGDGAYWADGDEGGSNAAYEAEVVDRIGAGDAFAAGVLLGVLKGDLPGGVDCGLAMAALKLGILGDQLIARPEEVDQIRGGHRREVAR